VEAKKTADCRIDRLGRLVILILNIYLCYEQF
jgi:hypothetical protein